MAGVAVEKGVLRAGEPEDLGLVEGSVELVALGDGGEVEEGALGGGDGDTVLPCHLVGGKKGVVKKESWPRVKPPWDGDLHMGRRGRADAPERGRGTVAQDRAPTRGEDRRHPSPLPRQDGVPNRIHARMHGMHSTPFNAPFDRARGDAERKQLTPAHHPVLLAGEGRNRGFQATSS